MLVSSKDPGNGIRGPYLKKEERRKEEREASKLSAAKGVSPSPPFIEEVVEEVLFMPHSGVCIYKNAAKGYWFQILFCEP
jgi:hypothetical protein